MPKALISLTFMFFWLLHVLQSKVILAFAVVHNSVGGTHMFVLLLRSTIAKDTYHVVVVLILEGAV